MNAAPRGGGLGACPQKAIAILRLMSQRSQRLLELQRLDAETARLTGLLKQSDAALADRTQARAAEYAIRQAEGALTSRQSEQRDREFALSTLEARIKDHEQRLYSGKGSPRDLQTLQQDIERDKARRGTLEEEALTAMDATEGARKEVQRIKTAAERVLGEAATRHDRQQRERDAAGAGAGARHRPAGGGRRDGGDGGRGAVRPSAGADAGRGGRGPGDPGALRGVPHGAAERRGAAGAPGGGPRLLQPLRAHPARPGGLRQAPERPARAPRMPPAPQSGRTPAGRAEKP